MPSIDAQTAGILHRALGRVGEGARATPPPAALANWAGGRIGLRAEVGDRVSDGVDRQRARSLSVKPPE